MNSDKPNFSLEIPADRITYHGCRARVPYQLRVELALSDVFGLHVHGPDDLPLRLVFHPVPGQELQPPSMPFPFKGGITVAWIDRHLSAVAIQKNPVAFILQEGSFRVGIQRYLLEWLASDCEVRMILERANAKPGFVSKFDLWKIELACGGETVAGWESSEANIRIPYLGPSD